MQLCQNCHKEIGADKYPLHLNYCRRNIKPCPQCSRPFDINYEQQHLQQFHRLETCKHCGIQFSGHQINAHVQNCMDRPDVCIYCELPVPNSKREQHRAWCEARTKTCQKCRKPVMNRGYFDHVDDCAGVSNSHQFYSFPSNTNYSNSDFESSHSSQSIHSSPSQSQTISSSLSSPTSSSYISSSSSSYQNSHTNPARTNNGTHYHNSEAPTYGHRNASHGSSFASYSSNPYSAQSGSYHPSRNTNTKNERVINRRVITHPYTPTSTNQAQQSANYGSQSPGYQEDNDLQAALMASLGCYDQNSAELYRQIQEQAELQKRFRK